METPNHFLARLIQSLAPTGAARTDTEYRRAAITAIFQALNPVTGREAMFACTGIVMQFAMDDAARQAASPDISPSARTRAWAAVLSAGRQMGHWLRQLDIAKKERTRAAPRQAAAPPAEAPPAEAPPAEAPQAEAPRVEAPRVDTPPAGRSGTLKAALLSSTARYPDLPISLGQMIAASSRGILGGGPPRKPLPAGSG